TQTYVVASSAKDGAAGAAIGYTTPGDKASRHVVFDAPEDPNGQSKVDAHADGGKCVVSVTAGARFDGHPPVLPLKAAAEGCLATEDKSSAPASSTPGNAPDAGASAAANAAAAAAGAGKDDGGCGCRVGMHRSIGVGGALAALLAAGIVRR